MTKVKLNEDYITTVTIEKGIVLRLTNINGLYDLECRNYNVTIGFASSKLCENKKRLSTINKQAARFNIEFIA